jgi:hypothetical protein
MQAGSRVPKAAAIYVLSRYLYRSKLISIPWPMELELLITDIPGNKPPTNNDQGAEIIQLDLAILK